MGSMILLWYPVSDVPQRIFASLHILFGAGVVGELGASPGRLGGVQLHGPIWCAAGVIGISLH